jgi:hypothetical protein
VRGISIALVDRAGDVIVVSSGSLLVDTRTGAVGSSSDAVPRPAPSRNGIALRGGNVTIYTLVCMFWLGDCVGAEFASGRRYVVGMYRRLSKGRRKVWPGAFAPP